MISPPIKLAALSPKDKVAVCAPSGPVTPEAFSKGLEILGARYDVHFSPGLSSRRHGYLAGDDRERLDELQAAISDPSIKAVFCARGGFGAMRIADLLDLKPLSQNPKPLIGFSDITVLLLRFQFLGIVCFHGPVVTQMGKLPSSDLEHLWRMLEDPDYLPSYEGKDQESTNDWKKAEREEKEDKNDEEFEGILWGGNLAVLAACAGSFSPDKLPQKSLLALEETGEPPYRIDRMLTQLHRAGILDRVQAVAVGKTTRPTKTSNGEWVDEDSDEMTASLCTRLSQLGLPWVSGFPWGHGNTNRAWPTGAKASLYPGRKLLQILEPPVS